MLARNSSFPRIVAYGKREVSSSSSESPRAEKSVPGSEDVYAVRTSTEPILSLTILLA